MNAVLFIIPKLDYYHQVQMSKDECKYLIAKEPRAIIGLQNIKIKYVSKKIGLLLRVTTDLFFEVSIQNFFSNLLTFIRKK